MNDNDDPFIRGEPWKAAIIGCKAPPFGFPIIRLSAERYRRWLLPERRPWWVRLFRRLAFLVVAYSPSLEAAFAGEVWVRDFMRGLTGDIGPLLNDGLRNVSDHGQHPAN